MPDISMCYGKGCLAAHKCYRCVMTPGPNQSYSDFDTLRGENGICSYFWDISGDDSPEDNGFLLDDKGRGN